MPDISLSALDIARILNLPRPTQEQIRVIEAPLEPVIVVAGAGSGKTETMAARVVWLVANQIVSPHQILGLTFTRKAAGELAERIDRRLRALRQALGRDSNSDLADQPTVQTYNSYASALVAEHGLRIGIEPDAQLMTDAGVWQLAAQLVESWPHDLGTTKRLGTIIAAVVALDAALNDHLCEPARAQQWMAELADQLSSLPYGPRRHKMSTEVTKLIESLQLRSRLLDIVAQLRVRKQELGVLTFSDQMASAARLAMQRPVVAASERTRFGVVLLDEFQDTSYAQTAMLSALFGGGHPIMAVGDPHQSIYAWRGASASSLVRFPEEFARADNSRARVLSLSTSWRNDTAVLDVANVIARPLRDRLASIEVPELQPRPDAAGGSVTWNYAASMADEVQQAADFIAKRWGGSTAGQRESHGRQQVVDSGVRPSMAVLCRARKYFPMIQHALQERGIPVEIVGLGGLLDVPEVADVLSCLQVAHDPSRGDALFRLLTGPAFNIAPSDVAGLRRIARRLDLQALQALEPAYDDDDSNDGTAIEGQCNHPDGFVAHSLADALDWLVDHEKVGDVISLEGLGRFRRLGSILRELRANMGLPLTEVLAIAEQLLGLDIEVRLAYGDGTGRIHLDALRSVAAGFAANALTATVGAFLAWVEAAKREERGLDRPVAAPDPNAVQIITVHSAKGLEWDVVASVGLAEGEFPSVRYKDGLPQDSAWITSDQALPYPLRGDYTDLERLDLQAGDSAQMENNLHDFWQRVGESSVLEERRLAYVAVTRARHELFVSGAQWLPGRKTRCRPSIFLADIVGSSFARKYPGSLSLEDVVDENPQDDIEQIAWWPRAEPVDEHWSGQVELADRVLALLNDEESARQRGIGEESPRQEELDNNLHETRAHIALESEDSVAKLVSDDRDDIDISHMRELARLLLAERDNASEPTPLERLRPSHMSASMMVQYVADPKQVIEDWKRPIPRQPSPQARTGTAIHAWIENYYRKPATLDFGDEELYEDADYVNDLSQFQAGFSATPWAALAPIALEEPVDLVVGEVTIRTRIDAVFADPDNPGHHIIVDWKSGREPTDEAQLQARKVQLAIYKIAWSRLMNKPQDEIHTAFCYVATGKTVRHDDLPNETELAQLLHAGHQ